MLNQLPLKEIFAGLSDIQQQELEHIRLRLDPNLHFSKDARYAPSIITRSELQIFGCSTPRFAHRLYFTNSDGHVQDGFINIRRRTILKKTDRRQAENPQPSKDQEKALTQSEIAHVLGAPNQSCIADSLLPCPLIYRSDDFHILTACLSDAYGETYPGVMPSYAGTPFVKNISLGGGLCAQACSFMATTLLHAYATGIYGLSEITALAHSTRANRIIIGGLSHLLMARYFDSVGLVLTQQNSHERAVLGVRHEGSEVLDFRRGIESYLKSGFPILLPVDCNKLEGYFTLGPGSRREIKKSIYWKNGLYETDGQANVDSTRSTPNHHCVLIVGYEKARNSSEAMIIFNDPGSHPFMEATAADLLDACQHVKEYPKKARGTFYSVTPKKVKLPLLDFKPWQSFDYKMGLKTMSRAYRMSKLRHPTDQETSYQLIQLSNLEQIRKFEPMILSTEGRWELVRAQLREMKNVLRNQVHWQNDHWIWLEATRDAIFAWDAEADPLLHTPEECLIARFPVDGNRVLTIWTDGFELS